MSFISDLVTDVESAAAVVCDGGYEVETIAHAFVQGHLEPAEASWLEPRRRLSA